ncbi:MAG: type I 3-dehydroquinate dehydratase [Promethearchaeota archaeon]
MYPKTVICINGTTPQTMIALIKQAETETNVPIFEIRADYLKKGDLVYKTLEKIRNSTRRKLIFTLRKKDEGGMLDLDDGVRKNIFLDAIDLKFDYIDVEFSSSKELLTILNNRKSSSIILSYHNFDKTDQKDIEDHYKAIKFLNPDIIKIVTLAKSDKDNKIVESLLVKYRTQLPSLICFCMGVKGKKSRINGYKLGNTLTYLALGDKTATASGQLTYKEFLEI